MPPTDYIWSIQDLFVLVDVTSSEPLTWEDGDCIGFHAYARASQIASQEQDSRVSLPSLQSALFPARVSTHVKLCQVEEHLC